MRTIKVGNFPGVLKEVTVQCGTTVADVMALAELAVAPEQEIRMDGEVVDSTATIGENNSMIVIAKRIKGA